MARLEMLARSGLTGLAVLASLAWGRPAVALGRPERVVSLNMCTDELLLRLAAPGQVASVTWLSQDPRGANMADAAARLPANHGLSEEALALDPDLVIAGTFTTRTTVAFLKRTRIPVFEFGVPQTLPEVRQQIRAVAAAIGRPERGEEVVAELDRWLEAARPASPPTRRPRAVVLRPNGVTVGRGSLVDELLTMAGLDNLAADLGWENYGQVPLETVVLGDVDVLVIDAERGEAPALATELLRHPILGRLRRRIQVAAVPSRLWTCPGPALAQAVAILAEAGAAARGHASP